MDGLIYLFQFNMRMKLAASALLYASMAEFMIMVLTRVYKDVRAHIIHMNVLENLPKSHYAILLLHLPGYGVSCRQMDAMRSHRTFYTSVPGPCGCYLYNRL